MQQCGTVNTNLGSQCGRNDGVCYRTIELVVGEVVSGEFVEDETCKIVCPATDSEETLELIEEMEENKEKWNMKFCEHVVANQGKTLANITPAVFKNYITACAKGILPVKVSVGE